MKRTKAAAGLLLTLALGLSACGQQGGGEQSQQPDPAPELDTSSALALYQKGLEKLQEKPVQIKRTGTMDSEMFRVQGLTFTETMQAQGLGTSQLSAQGTYHQENEEQDYNLTYSFPNLTFQVVGDDHPWTEEYPYYLDFSLPGEADHEGTVEQKEDGTVTCTFTYGQADVTETTSGLLHSILPAYYRLYWSPAGVAPDEEGIRQAEVVATLSKEGELQSIEVTYGVIGGIQDTGLLTGTTTLTFGEGEAQAQPQEGASEPLRGEELKKEQANLWREVPEEFIFSSGAGGWATIIQIADDGSFTGEYFDGELGDVGANYPNGTVYICNFHGKFSQPEQVERGIYSTRLESLEMERTPGEVYYEDGTRYICAEPYGFEGADEFLIYRPGLPVDSLPSSFRDWMQGIAPLGNEKYLPYYGLYNVKDELGFGGVGD